MRKRFIHTAVLLIGLFALNAGMLCQSMCATGHAKDAHGSSHAAMDHGAGGSHGDHGACRLDGGAEPLKAGCKHNADGAALYECDCGGHSDVLALDFTLGKPSTDTTPLNGIVTIASAQDLSLRTYDPIPPVGPPKHLA